ncbi:peptidase A24A domain protein [Rhodopirellula sallentina SM41]|uniref:Peptidase A24A domain protein n=2 Tax=Rhodopirellula TaxID=265488 RepID=M5UJL5_9BACT|nr:peptidase A24A domain protein [Rhodopirellula sallentina SM41]
MESNATWMLVGNALVLAYLVSTATPMLFRVTLLGLALFFSITAYQQTPPQPSLTAANFFCNPVALMWVAAFLAVLETIHFTQNIRSKLSPRGTAFLLAGLGLLGYLVLLPTVETIWNSTQETPSSYTLEEPTAMEHLRIRSSKVVIFAIFAAAGACFGSFLNVVADSAPRGRSIAFRDSACPQCGTKIRRIDNIPIISYLNLKGQCRDCHTPIPARYFLVELTTMFLFASLFLYELVTGAANVPSFPHYSYTGIVWIILYTKWPVVGIYLFHCLVFCFILTLALMETDRLRCPTWLATVMLLTTISIALATPHCVPVTIFEQTSIPANRMPQFFTPVATVIAGAFAGWGISTLASFAQVRSNQPRTSTTLAALLIGVALGWQATLTIGAIWIGMAWTSRFIGGRKLRPRWLTPTMLLFLAVMLHHPAWNWLTSQW